MEKQKNKDLGSLEDLKKNYELLRKQYGLPEFKLLNENFDIENILIYEGDLLIKKIRKQITEKIYSYLRLFEVILNPSNAPLFIFNLLKSMSVEDKDKAQKLYRDLSKFEIDSFELEVIYNPKKEAQMIKEIYDSWQPLSKELIDFFLNLKNKYNFDSKKSEKSYFG